VFADFCYAAFYFQKMEKMFKPLHNVA
jgi:hypothetical protein